MKAAILVLSIVGGIFGLIAVAITFIGSAIIAGLGANITAGQAVSKSLWLTLFSIVGIVGGTLTKSRSIFGGILLFISVIGGLITLWIVYILPAIFFFVAGILALMSKKESK